MQIAFSGKLGSGKSTVCDILNKQYGYSIYSTGTIQRKIAEDMGITTLELNKRMREDPALDHVIDDAVVELSRERKGEKLIYDSRMAWHFAENTFKVYMYVDPTVAARRVLSADRGNVEKYETLEEAREMLIARSVEENSRFKKIYGVDNFDYNNYDLIIDSTSATPEMIAKVIAESAEEFECAPFESTRLMLSPYVIFPTKRIEDDGSDELVIALKDGMHFAINGHKKLCSAQDGNLSFVSAELTDATVILDAELIALYEDKNNFKYQTKPF